jgi:adenylylsulfate kinase
MPGVVIWLTGIPGSGKTTLALAIAQRLANDETRLEIIDGDDFRARFSPDLGYSLSDRALNVKRAAYISELLCRNGVIVIASFVSPIRSSRDAARAVIGRFVEVHVQCSLATARLRDPKGLYRAAATGGISDLTGVDQSYEEPTAPELVVNTEESTIDEGAEAIINRTRSLGYLT